MKRIIYTQGPYRIIEQEDNNFIIEDLEGDIFNPKVNPQIEFSVLLKQQKDFRNKVNDLGVFGYTLEKWDPSVGMGWEHIDSCWGFVGMYDPNSSEFNHYIVDELKSQIEKG